MTGEFERRFAKWYDEELADITTKTRHGDIDIIFPKWIEDARKEFPNAEKIEKEFEEDYHRIIVFIDRLNKWYAKWFGEAE